MSMRCRRITIVANHSEGLTCHYVVARFHGDGLHVSIQRVHAVRAHECHTAGLRRPHRAGLIDHGIDIYCLHDAIEWR